MFAVRLRAPREVDCPEARVINLVTLDPTRHGTGVPKRPLEIGPIVLFTQADCAQRLLDDFRKVAVPSEAHPATSTGCRWYVLFRLYNDSRVRAHNMRAESLLLRVVGVFGLKFTVD